MELVRYAGFIESLRRDGQPEPLAEQTSLQSACMI
jgi:hypothetical protein